jgi:ketosteroid isomerase-like protein
MVDLNEGLRRLIDEAEIKALALGYAQAADRRDAAALMALFSDDGTIGGLGVAVRGMDQIAKIPSRLTQRFDQTYHTVFNHLITVSGDAAEGEVYSTAHHLKRQDDGRTSDYIMVITYRDRYVRQAAGWRFAHRQLEMQWTQTLWVDPDGTV